MNGNKNGKNEDEFEKSAHVKEGEREKKIWALVFNSKEQNKKKFEPKERELHCEKEH